MKVKKENRVLTVDEADKVFYLSEGYDVVELNEKSKEYDIVEEATGGKTYSVAEYNTLKAEHDELKAENDELKAKIAELEKDTDWNEPPAELSRDEKMAALKEAEIDFPGNISNEKLNKLYAEHFEGDGE